MKDAAIWVTAKMRWRRPVLLVMRQARHKCQNHRGDDGQRHSHPEHTEIHRQIQRANGEARGVSSQDGDQWLRDDYADGRAGAAKQKAFG